MALSAQPILDIPALKAQVSNFATGDHFRSGVTTPWLWLLSSERQKRQQILHDHQRLLSVYLREPCWRVQRVLVRHAHYRCRLERLRNKPVAANPLRRYLQHFAIPQHAEYANLQFRDPRARILATFHYGDYVYGLNTLVHRVKHAGAVKVLSLQPGSSCYWQNIRKGFGGNALDSKSELLIESNTASKLSAFLRVRGNTLVMFCDLPPQFAEAIKVRFMGREAWFPRGPATVAVVNRVPLLPVICVCHQQHHSVLLYPQIESTPLPGESVANAVRRITRKLVSVLEEQLRREPEQWRYLQAMPTYFFANANSRASVMASTQSDN